MSKLDLTTTQRADLDRSYGAVTEALVNSAALKGILHRLDLRPQGSVRARTVNRPSGETRFDLDVLCWMEFISKHRSPEEVWQLVWNALGEHGVYKNMREPKARCIRLRFANDYDLDITPAIPDSTRPEPMLWVPDKSLKTWSASNPIGFCDHWLKSIAAQLPTTLTSLSATIVRKNATAAANTRSDRVEPLPTDQGFEKAPLLRLIQLVKHFRNEGYAVDDKNRPSSILLTTITAKAYQKALLAQHTSLNAFIIQVLATLKNEVGVTETAGIYHFHVLNPADDRRENFAEKWTLKTYGSFTRWADSLSSQVTKLMNTAAMGLDARIEVLNSTIPGAQRLSLADDIGREMRVMHDTGNLRLTAVPAMAASLTPIRPTTFFGNP
ncbi:nucleotidyltransferase [Prosthecobacter algae]